MDKIIMLQHLIDSSSKIVFFGGAGVSTESGIKDFRSKDGLYAIKYDYPPETILSHTFFQYKTTEFYKFYKDKLNTLDSLPNVCHTYLAKLEKQGKLSAVITQNIDGLHTKAGSNNVLELHGSIYNNRCTRCSKEYDAEFIFKQEGIPICDCGGIIKPNVVLYEEPLNDNIVECAIKEIEDSDLLIIAGTSLLVYPASSFIRYFRGKNLVIINKDSTPYDELATLIIHDKIGTVFSHLH